MNMKYSVEFEKLYMDCFKIEYETFINRLNIPIIGENHIIIYSEEPNIIGKYFLRSQHKSDYKLEQRVIHANLDGDNMDVEFYEAKLKNGKVGHIEFDFLQYQKNKIYYILDKVIEPVIETKDIGKILDENEQTSKLVYIKNLDVILSTLSDDKVEKKILCWLEKHIDTTKFLFTLNGNSINNTRKFINYSYTIRLPKIKIVNHEMINNWLETIFGIKVNSELKRSNHTFVGFRYYLRYLVDDQYYVSIYKLMDEIHKQNNIKDRYLLVRDFLIGWLQSGKNHKELLREIIYIISNVKHKRLREKLIAEVARRSTGLENSKKIIYHLENVLSVFVE